jgi:acetylornithine deacetylase/succinyl-diaminopimelate desuccinylase-like protein
MTDAELDRLYELLAIPSVSALADHAPDLARAAETVAGLVRRAGGQAEVVATARHPLVLGELPSSDGRPDAPTVLIYGHYDVQPVGDLGLWDTPPFEPTVVDGAIHCRGASDDKGNLYQAMVGVERLAAAGKLPVRVRYLIDGEEESGGDSAALWVLAQEELPDAALIWDGGLIAPGKPTICTGVRGMCYRRVILRAGERDGHSGLYGGAAMNAATALARLVASVAPVDGRLPAALTEGAAPIHPEETAVWETLPDGATMLAEAGLAPADSAAGAEFYTRTLAAPSLDVHALASGEPGAVKTVIPSVASAMLSVRLAPGQDPAVIGPALDELLAAGAPTGAVVEIERLGDALPAVMDPTDPVMRAAAAAIERATGWPALPVRSGGTLPVMASMVGRGIPTVLTGFAQYDDNIHAPNERMRLENMELGARAAMEILAGLGATARDGR